MDNVKQRRSKVTQDDFDQCVQGLLEKNIEPTVTKIVKEIGGSFSTISSMSEKWRNEKNQSLYDAGVPEFVKHASEKIGKEWWSLVQHDVTERVQQVEKDAQMRIKDIKLQCDEYLESIVDFEEALETKNKEIEHLTESHTKAITAVYSEITEYKLNQAKAQQSYQALVETSCTERDTIKSEFNTEKEKLTTQFKHQIRDEKITAEKMEKTLRELIDEKEKNIIELKTKLAKAN